MGSHGLGRVARAGSGVRGQLHWQAQGPDRGGVEQQAAGAACVGGLLVARLERDCATPGVGGARFRHHGSCSACKRAPRKQAAASKQGPACEQSRLQSSICSVALNAGPSSSSSSAASQSHSGAGAALPFLLAAGGGRRRAWRGSAVVAPCV